MGRLGGYRADRALAEWSAGGLTSEERTWQVYQSNSSVVCKLTWLRDDQRFAVERLGSTFEAAVKAALDAYKEDESN